MKRATHARLGVTASAWAAAVSAAALSVSVHRELGRSGVLDYIAPRPQATLVLVANADYGTPP